MAPKGFEGRRFPTTVDGKVRTDVPKLKLTEVTSVPSSACSTTLPLMNFPG
jgi:hypothetical protein